MGRRTRLEVQSLLFLRPPLVPLLSPCCPDLRAGSRRRPPLPSSWPPNPPVPRDCRPAGPAA
ncbi:hypothetical protein MC885_013382 [Smutsia gigantea]|nr:hypothetical protein MC885_013382 [Smutsia gigantea]